MYATHRSINRASRVHLARSLDSFACKSRSRRSRALNTPKRRSCVSRAIAARTRASWCVIRTRSISFTRVMSPRALVSYSRDVRSTVGRARAMRRRPQSSARERASHNARTGGGSPQRTVSDLTGSRAHSTRSRIASRAGKFKFETSF